MLESVKWVRTDWYGKMTVSLTKTFSLIRSDFIKRCEYEKKSPNWLQAIKFLFYPAFASILLYRLQYFLACHHLGWLATILKTVNQLLFSVSIDNTAKIGPRFMILHASFIVIGPRVRIGEDCIVVHHNSVIASPFFEAGRTSRAPVVGDGVIIGGGAQVTGDISLGDHVQVSMNASVEDSFDDHAVLFGVPARNLHKQASED